MGSTTIDQPVGVRESARLDWLGWAQVLLLAALLTLFSYRVLIIWAEQLWTDPYYSHCFLVPLFSIWVIWNRRDIFKNRPWQPSWTGFAVSLSAASLLTLAVLGNEHFVARISFVFLLAGICIQLCGWKFFRAGLFPWAVLFLAIPLPRILFSQLTLPLQFLSSHLGSSLLALVGVANVREGNLIHLHSLTLDVAEACSGLRSIMSLITVSVFYGYIFEFKPVGRVALILCSIPVAITANALRIMASGVVGQYWGPDKSEGFLHAFSGVLVFFFSFVLLMVLGQAFRWALRPTEHGTAA